MILKSRAIIVAIILITTGITAHQVYDRYFSEDESRFQWPEKIETPCQPNTEGFECENYLQLNSTPVKTVTNPSNEEIWIAEIDGKISSWDGQLLEEIGNISQFISRCHNEQGLLGFEFTHDFNISNEILLSYTGNIDCDGSADLSNVMVASIEVIDGNLAMNTLVELRIIEKQNRNHNGGNLHSLGNGTYLWSVGDGGGSGDPFENGQNINSPLGTIQYFSYDNKTIEPVLDYYENDTDYVLHHGLRNPWKFDVDNAGRLWIADVGQYCYEEVNVVEVFNQSNFGWSTREGKHLYDPSDDCTSPPSPLDDRNLTDPIAEYPHYGGNCSIIGGYWLDKGPESLINSYIYGDFCTGSIWKITDSPEGLVSVFVTNLGTYITGFGQGLNNELLIFSWTGEIYNLY